MQIHRISFPNYSNFSAKQNCKIQSFSGGHWEWDPTRDIDGYSTRVWVEDTTPDDDDDDMDDYIDFNVVSKTPPEGDSYNSNTTEKK